MVILRWSYRKIKIKVKKWFFCNLPALLLSLKCLSRKDFAVLLALKRHVVLELWQSKWIARTLVSFNARSKTIKLRRSRWIFAAVVKVMFTSFVSLFYTSYETDALLCFWWKGLHHVIAFIIALSSSKSYDCSLLRSQKSSHYRSLLCTLSTAHTVMIKVSCSFRSFYDRNFHFILAVMIAF